MTGLRLFLALTLLLTSIVFPPLFTFGEEPAALKLAILDVDRVRRDAAAVKSIRSQLGTYIDSYRADTQKEEQALRNADAELARKRTVLSPEAYAAERQKLEQRLADAQGKVQQRSQSLQKVQAEAMQKVQDALAGIVTKIASERSFTLILRKDQTVYSASALEITDDVLKQLDKQLPSVQIANPDKKG